VGSSADPARRAAEALAGIRAALKEVSARAEAARTEKDVVRLNCVNERLTQIRSLLKVAEQSERSRAEAAARRDAGADAHLAQVGTASSRVETLRSESEQCGGQVAYAVEDRTRVEVQEPEALAEPSVEPGGGVRPVPPPPPVVRPGPASPFQ
jgi:hypothetical protein